ncbi:hypothetical protein [Tepidibacillus marianensis]
MTKMKVSEQVSSSVTHFLSIDGIREHGISFLLEVLLMERLLV